MRIAKRPLLTRLKFHLIPGIILLAGLLHGLLYVFLIPPWQHYDEPGHFEFAWLIANRPGLPEVGDYDQFVRRAIAASMLEHDFFARLDYRPNLLSIDEPVWIGVSQVSTSPLYHWLVALPLRLLRFSDVTFQLYIARLVSLLLYLVTIVAAYGATLEFSQRGHPLTWMVPATLALLPGTSDLMTALNDDVGATAFFSLFLWASLRLFRRGFSWLRLAALLAALVACLLTKSTVLIVLLLAPLALLLTFLGPASRDTVARQTQGVSKSRRGSVWQIAALLALVPLVGLLAVLRWDDAANWSRLTYQDVPTRVEHPSAQLGERVFQLVASEQPVRSQVLQVLSQKQVHQLRGQTVTLGAWMWASQPTRAYTPVITDQYTEHFEEIQLEVEPRFYTLTTQISPDSNRINISLMVLGRHTSPGTVIYMDGVILAPVSPSAGKAPIFLDAAGQQANWAGQPVNNLLRNPSAEASWPWIRPQIERRVKDHFPGRPALILSTLLDWEPTSWYYYQTARHLHATFWGQFGWGNVPLRGPQPYRILLVATFLGLSGAGLAVWRWRRGLLWNGVVLLGITLALIWGMTLVRGIDSIMERPFIPSARYAFPAIIPTVLVLTAGWLELLCRLEERLRLPGWLKTGVFLFFLVGLDVLAVISISRYFGY